MTLCSFTIGHTAHARASRARAPPWPAGAPRRLGAAVVAQSASHQDTSKFLLLRLVMHDRAPRAIYTHSRRRASAYTLEATAGFCSFGGAAFRGYRDEVLGGYIVVKGIYVYVSNSTRASTSKTRRGRRTNTWLVGGQIRIRRIRWRTNLTNTCRRGTG